MYFWIKKGVKLVSFVISIFLIIVTFSSNTYSFGISTPYFEDSILKVNSGKQYLYPVTIQNGDDKDYYVDISYYSTNNVVKLAEESYYIPKETYDTIAHFLIYIPNESVIGDKYVLNYTLKPRISAISYNDDFNYAVEIQRYLVIEVVDEFSQDRIILFNKNFFKNLDLRISSIILVILLIIVLLMLLFRKYVYVKKKSRKIFKRAFSNSVSGFVNNINIFNFIMRKKNLLLWKMSNKDVIYELAFLKKEYDAGKISFKEYNDILKRMGYIDINKEKDNIILPVNDYKSELRQTILIKGLDTKVSEDRAFVLNDLRKLYSIQDLINVLPEMSQDLFMYHINDNRNDFADWIKNVFLLDELSITIRNCNTKEELLAILKNH